MGLSPLKNEKGMLEYELKAHLPDTLITTYGMRIPLTPNMPGMAMVVTKDRRILERVMQQFLDILKNK